MIPLLLIWWGKFLLFLSKKRRIGGVLIFSRPWFDVGISKEAYYWWGQPHEFGFWSYRDQLKLPTESHPYPYKVAWVENTTILVNKWCFICTSIDSYSDSIIVWPNFYGHCIVGLLMALWPRCVPLPKLYFSSLNKKYDWFPYDLHYVCHTIVYLVRNFNVTWQFFFLFHTWFAGTFDIGMGLYGCDFLAWYIDSYFFFHCVIY